MRMGLRTLNAHRPTCKYFFMTMYAHCVISELKILIIFLRLPDGTGRPMRRATLLPRTFQILKNLANQYVLFSTRQSSSELHQLVLNGSSLLPPDVNLQVV